MVFGNCIICGDRTEYRLFICDSDKTPKVLGWIHSCRKHDYNNVVDHCYDKVKKDMLFLKARKTPTSPVNPKDFLIE